LRTERSEAERRGRRAERIAACYLRLTGWRILGQRVRTPVGEVDLVARRGKVLAFVEVKARADERAAAVALDRQRLRRVARAAELLLPRFARGAETVRIDAVFILPWRWPRHVVNVWDG
jgi:putative endonuclease